MSKRHCKLAFGILYFESIFLVSGRLVTMPVDLCALSQLQPFAAKSIVYYSD